MSEEAIEFLRWYQSGAEMVRCTSCGSILLDGDTETHLKWHQKLGEKQ